jgi:hypothetical protein
MTCFDLSKSPSDEITQSICHLVVSIRWWASSPLVSREKMMRPKEEGGLGFRDLHLFNLLMLEDTCGVWFSPQTLYVVGFWKQSILKDTLLMLNPNQVWALCVVAYWKVWRILNKKL